MRNWPENDPEYFKDDPFRDLPHDDVWNIAIIAILLVGAAILFFSVLFSDAKAETIWNPPKAECSADMEIYWPKSFYGKPMMTVLDARQSSPVAETIAIGSRETLFIRFDAKFKCITGWRVVEGT